LVLGFAAALSLKKLLKNGFFQPSPYTKLEGNSFFSLHYIC